MISYYICYGYVRTAMKLILRPAVCIKSMKPFFPSIDGLHKLMQPLLGRPTSGFPKCRFIFSHGFAPNEERGFERVYCTRYKKQGKYWFTRDIPSIV